MPRKGQQQKRRKTIWPKPVAPRANRPDDLMGNPLVGVMEEHFEWMLVTGYSAQTVSRRRIAIRRFIRWCDERGIRQPQDITRPILERYQRHLYHYRNPETGQPLTTGSQMGCLAPLKTWFKWLVRGNRILYNPAGELQLPKVPHHLPRSILSVAEVEAILAQAEATTAEGLRDRAMLELLYSTGLRRMEVVGLACHDLDTRRGVLFVREGKGRRDRVVPVGARALAWVDKYLSEARPQLAVGGVGNEAVDNAAGGASPLFLTDYGEAIKADHLADKVKRYMEFAGVHKAGSTHLLRHACATHMLEGGADIRYIQALLGHRKLDTTEIYTHVSIEKLKAIHEATHPARLTRPSKRADKGADKGVDEGGVGVGLGDTREALEEALSRECDAEVEDDDGVGDRE